MKALLKLAFVALLVCFILTWPRVARADYQVGPYLCSSDYETCTNNATQTIDQCMADCFDTGNDGTYEQICYNEAEINAYNNGGQSYIVYIDWTTTCNDVPQQGYTCAQTCANNYQYQVNSCVNQYCQSD